MQLQLVIAAARSSSSSSLKEKGVLPYTLEDVESETSAFALFESWNLKHGKNYGSDNGGEAEKRRRFQIFRENLERIHQHNSRGSSSFTLGLTRFADLTNDEFRSSNYFGARWQKNLPEELISRRRNSTTASASKKLHTCDTSDLDESFDWRDSDVVVDVKDQGSCGMSISFSLPSFDLYHFIVSSTLKLYQSKHGLKDPNLTVSVKS
jgi:hypothetical protein